MRLPLEVDAKYLLPDSPILLYRTVLETLVVIWSCSGRSVAFRGLKNNIIVFPLDFHRILLVGALVFVSQCIFQRPFSQRTIEKADCGRPKNLWLQKNEVQLGM